MNPYQPKGVWEEIAFGDGFTSQTYTQGHGDDLHRRSMYTFWKRTAPPPEMITFDAPDREKCTARRTITNTPLQALVLLNDPAFVEAARGAGGTNADGRRQDARTAGSIMGSAWPPRASRQPRETGILRDTLNDRTAGLQAPRRQGRRRC